MQHNKWYDNEIDIIYNNYKKMSDQELCFLIPKHSESSIATKRKELGLIRGVWNKKYSFADVERILNEKKYTILSTEDDFKNAGSKIKYICPIHHDKGVQYTTLGHLLENKGCIFCGHEKTGLKKRVLEEDVIQLCKKHNFIFNHISIENSKSFVYFICKNHKQAGIQKMTYQNMRRDICGCRYCRYNISKKSKGEATIKDFLDKLGITYLKEYKFNDCRDIKYLPFDFYLPEFKIVIEYDGEHHYRPVNFNSISDEEAIYTHRKTVFHDSLKNNYCKNNKIKIIRIPYWDLEDIDIILFDKLVKYKVIKEIA